MTNVNAFVIQSNVLHIDFFGVSEYRLTSCLLRDEVLTIPNCSGTAVHVQDSVRDFTCGRYDSESVHVESVWFQVKSGRGPAFLLRFIIKVINSMSSVTRPLVIRMV